MLHYTIENAQALGPCNVTANNDCREEEVVQMELGRVHLLRRKAQKKAVLTPHIPTQTAMILYPMSEVSLMDLTAKEKDEDATPRAVPGLLSEKLPRFLQHLTSSTGVTLTVARVVLCLDAATALLLVKCPTAADTLQVISVCNDGTPPSTRLTPAYPQAFPTPTTPEIPTDTTETVVAPHRFYEIPTCVLCADRLEAGMTGKPASMPLCEHAGHRYCSCLQFLGCRVCRIFRNPDAPDNIKCEACGQPNDPWICLICGYVGCSRYQAMHAKSHYARTDHFFSINLLTQQIWDYDGDDYSHRLVFVMDTHSGGATRVQLPEALPDHGTGDEDTNNNNTNDEKELTSVPPADGNVSYMSEDSPWCGAGEACAGKEKKCVSAKFDATMSTSHTQYAMLVKNELDAMRAVYERTLPSASTDAASTSPASPPPAQSLGTSSRAATFDVAAAMEEGLRDCVEGFHRDVAASAKVWAEMEHTVRQLASLSANTALAQSQLSDLENELRAVVSKDVAKAQEIDARIADLTETLNDVRQTLSAQRQLQARLGASDGVSRVVVGGGTGGNNSKKRKR